MARAFAVRLPCVCRLGALSCRPLTASQQRAYAVWGARVAANGGHAGPQASARYPSPPPFTGYNAR